ncbi:MAG TPA: murein biosynthesis integral membrane protein MurJ [Pyrinomonadaceae bacterium]|jgi:putative peptidoglycan lipid II flippase|nr:murein biosynthesis integral membrane protein MurJ [Pyrinomonadaceae bacterium]
MKRETEGERGDADLIAGQRDVPVGTVTGEFPFEKQAQRRKAQSTGKGAFLVGAGILLSRIVGVVRQRVFAYFLGNSGAMDAFQAAFRIPNFLQNVFGEGALSASFIPVYAKLLVDDEEEADRVAWSVFSILALVVSVIVLIGVLATPILIPFIAQGFEGEKRALTTQLVRIFFPGAGLLVLSAWCLGVLNSHRRFFLSYTAPVIWNLTLIAALAWAGWPVRHVALTDLGVWGHVAAFAAWGSVVGSALQFGVQLPTVLMLLRRVRPALGARNVNVRTVLRNFLPVFFSRGVVQISAFVDAWLASWLGTGAVSALGYAQSLYTLPVSLFGISVSAAELPEMSSAVGEQSVVAEKLRARLDAGLRQIALFIVPSSMGLFALGDVMAGALYQNGKFGRSDTVYVWAILAGSAVGLLASTLGRLYASTYYALHDTRTPLRFAIVRVSLTTVLGYLFSLPLPRALGIPQHWGAVGLTASAGLAGWVEFVLLRRSLNRRIGWTGLPLPYVSKLWLAAALSAAVAWGLKLALGPIHPIPLAALVLTPYGLLFFALTSAFGLPESRAVVGRVLRMLRLGKP